MTITVVLARPSHPGNIGAAARAMKTMGFDRLALVSPREFPSAEATALAAGAADVLERAMLAGSLEEALGSVKLAVGFSARTRDLSLPAFALREAAARIAHAAGDGDIALVFGNETNGLSNDELGRCQWLATIPANPAYGSLNLAAAVQVACYELALALENTGVSPARPRELATIEDLEGLYAHFEETAVASGYLDPKRPGRLMLRLRRLFARTRMEREEVRFLRGFLAAVQSRLRR
ncbi:MAG: RNA methyltransferase [Bacillota bacterium]